tara:strand:+ start:5967 stop:7196 length:1230 start_codon:yes stop_codon:yes gene_type:complete
MGNKTDVGVLSIFATMDTTQFSKALKETGQKSKAWSLKVRGNLNTIGSSFTELQSKLSFFSAGLSGVGAAVTGFSQAWKLAMTGSVEDAEALQATLESLPFGFGEVARWAKKAIEALGLFKYEIEGLHGAEEAVNKIAESMFNMHLETLNMAEANKKFFEKVFPEEYATKAEARAAELGEVEKGLIEQRKAHAEAMELTQKKLDRLEAELSKTDIKGFNIGQANIFEADALLAKQRARQAKLEEAKVLRSMQQAEEKRLQALLAKEREFLKLKHEDLEKIRNEEEAERQEATRKEQEDLTKKLADEAKKKEAARAAEAKRKASALTAWRKKEAAINKKMLSQQEKVAKLSGMQMTGATESISTAVGSIKIRDESRTRALQQAQLAELKKETQILQDIHQELKTHKAVLI